MKRGDTVLVAAGGEFGKPRPALVIQSDVFSEYVTYLPITSDLLRVPNVRVPIQPTPANGLRLPSEIMVDLVQTSSLGRFGKVIGSIDSETMDRVEVSLSIHLGLDGQ